METNGKQATIDYNSLFNKIQELVLYHSPSGLETEIDRFLLEQFTALNVENWQDRAGNVIAKIPAQNSDKVMGKAPAHRAIEQSSPPKAIGLRPGSAGALPIAHRAIAITAHKDEIGMIVKSIDDDGCLQVRRLGGSFPWVYGEGVVDILGDQEVISGILSFGSRHVSHESPQKVQQIDTPLMWEDAWVETKCNIEGLTASGVRPGTRVVVGKHRKQPFRLKDYIASYTLDNKASVAILLALASRIINPPVDIYLVASAKEEVGAIGALYFTQNQTLDALIALEICPLADEYPIESEIAPVLLSQDNYGVYDEFLNAEIRSAASKANIPLQLAVLDGFGSDASIAMKFGHVSRGACLSFPTQNTHGYEIAHLGAIANCIEILATYCMTITP